MTLAAMAPRAEPNTTGLSAVPETAPSSSPASAPVQVVGAGVARPDWIMHGQE